MKQIIFYVLHANIFPRPPTDLTLAVFWVGRSPHPFDMLSFRF